MKCNERDEGIELNACINNCHIINFVILYNLGGGGGGGGLKE